MPVCEISYPRGLLSESEKNNVAQKMSGLLIEAEGLPDNPISRSICLVSINEQGSVYVGGVASDEGKVVIKIYAFHNAYTDDQKSELYKRATQIVVDEHPGSRNLGGKNVWCIILPIEQNNFGVDGVPVSLEMTRKIASS